MNITREHITQLLVGECRLSRADQRFLRYVVYLNKTETPITKNQNGLWEILLRKYETQLSKAGVNLRSQHLAHWQTSLIESIPKSTVDLVYTKGAWHILVKVRDWEWKFHNDFSTRFGTQRKKGNNWVEFSVPRLSALLTFLTDRNIPYTLSEKVSAIVDHFTVGPPEEWHIKAVAVKDHFFINNITEDIHSFFPGAIDLSLPQMLTLSHLGIPVQATPELDARFSPTSLKIATNRVSRVTAADDQTLLNRVSAAVLELSDPVAKVLIIMAGSNDEATKQLFDALKVCIGEDRCAIIHFGTAVKLMADILAAKPAFIITGYSYIAEHLIQLKEFKKLRTNIIVMDHICR